MLYVNSLAFLAFLFFSGVGGYLYKKEGKYLSALGWFLTAAMVLIWWLTFNQYQDVSEQYELLSKAHNAYKSFLSNKG